MIPIYKYSKISHREVFVVRSILSYSTAVKRYEGMLQTCWFIELIVCVAESKLLK